MGSIARMDPKLPPKCRDMSWPRIQPLAQNRVFQVEKGEPPLKQHSILWRNHIIKTKSKRTITHKMRVLLQAAHSREHLQN